jgi:hypothetical protein
MIRNTGSFAFTVYDFDGQNSIVTVAAGEAQYIYITDNPDDSGTWGIIAFGIGSSGADAATLAGYGLLAVGLTLNQSHPVVSHSSNYTVLDTDRAKFLTWLGGAGTFTLSSASSLGNNWFTMVRNSGTGSLTINTSGSDFINGSLSIVLQPSDSAFVVNSGSAFFTVGLGRNTQFNFSQLTKLVSSGTYVLTSAEASNTIQKYVGTLAGNVTIQVPPTIQVYYVQNAVDPTVNNYSLTLSTGVAGSASATVPANAQTILICDSVNIVAASSTITAGATSLALLNGSVSAPSLYFALETGTGLYRPSSGAMGLAVLGTNVVTWNTSGMTLPGVGTFLGGVSGGTF